MIDSDGNIVKPNFTELTEYAKHFSDLTAEKEQLLQELGPAVLPHLSTVTDRFYEILEKIPQAIPFLEGRTDALKDTHIKWMNSIFTGPYDEAYTEFMYNVGDVHVKVNLPVEFMSGGITLISNELNKIVCGIYNDNTQGLQNITAAINSILGFSLFVMQKSYHASVEEELEKFLLITGMSRPLFDKLASTYNKTQS